MEWHIKPIVHLLQGYKESFWASLRLSIIISFLSKSKSSFFMYANSNFSSKLWWELQHYSMISNHDVPDALCLFRYLPGFEIWLSIFVLSSVVTKPRKTTNVDQFCFNSKTIDILMKNSNFSWEPRFDTTKIWLQRADIDFQ